MLPQLSLGWSLQYMHRSCPPNHQHTTSQIPASRSMFSWQFTNELCSSSQTRALKWTPKRIQMFYNSCSKSTLAVLQMQQYPCLTWTDSLSSFWIRKESAVWKTTAKGLKCGGHCSCKLSLQNSSMRNVPLTIHDMTENDVFWILGLRRFCQCKHCRKRESQIHNRSFRTNNNGTDCNLLDITYMHITKVQNGLRNRSQTSTSNCAFHKTKNGAESYRKIQNKNI